VTASRLATDLARTIARHASRRQKRTVIKIGSGAYLRVYASGDNLTIHSEATIGSVTVPERTMQRAARARTRPGRELHSVARVEARESAHKSPALSYFCRSA
jgi:hypothetical protein